MNKYILTASKIIIIGLIFSSLGVKAQFSTPTIDATNDGVGVYPNNYVSGTSTWYMTWNDTDLSVFLQNANETEPITIYLDVDPIVPVNGGTNANGTLVGLNYDSYSPAPNLPFRADVCIYAHNGYREIFRRDGANGWTSLGGGNDGICGSTIDDYTGNTNGQYASNDNSNGAGGDDRREFKISWARLQGAINSGARPAAFNWMGYVAYNNGMYAQVPVENYNGSAVSSNSNSIVRYFTVLNTDDGTSTNPFSLNSYTQPLAIGAATFGGISVWDFTMNSPSQTITRTTGAGGAWNIGGSLVVANGTLSSGSSTNPINTQNLEIRGGTLDLSSAVGGDLNISGNFNKTLGTFNCNSRQVDFNGTTAQSYTSNAAEDINYFRNSNTSAALTLNSNINIPTAGNAAALEVNSNTILSAGKTFSIVAGATATVDGTLTNSGVVSAAAADLIFSATGVYQHNYTTTLGVVPAATWNSGSTCEVIGYTNALTAVVGTGFGQSFSNFTWNCANQGTNNFVMNGFLNNIGGNLTILNSGTTGSLFLSTTAVATVNVGGNLIISGGTLTLSTTAASNLNVAGNFSQSGGTINLSTTTGAPFLNIAGDFTQTSGTLNKAVSTTVVGTVQFSGSANQNIAITDPNNITNSVSFRLNNASGITILNGSTLPINTVASFRRTLGAVSVIGTGAIAYDAINSRLTYDGTTDITTSGEWPAANGPVHVTLGHTALSNISLNASRTLPATGIISFSANNRLILGSSDLTLNNTIIGAIAGTFGANAMVVADGTGRLVRSIATGITYTWPIGDMTGTTDYTPVTLNFSASSTARDIGFSVVDGIHPDMDNPDPQAHYRSRYFNVYNSAAGTYTYTGSFTFITGAPDNVGTFGNTKINMFDGVNWTQAPITNTNTLVLLAVTGANPLDETLMPLVTGNEFTGRSTPQVYTWIPTTGTESFALASNWSPARTVLSFDDVLLFTNGGSSTANLLVTQQIGRIEVSNNTDITLSPTAANAIITLTGVNGDDLFVETGSVLTIGGGPSIRTLTMGNLSGSANTNIIAGTLNIAKNTGISVYAVGNATCTVNGTINNDGTLTTTSSTTAINGVLNNNGTLTTTTSTTTVNGVYNTLTLGASTSTAATLSFTAGATYNHERNSGLVAVAAWDANSTCSVNGITATIPTGLNQAFGNFIWNCTAQSANLIMGAGTVFTTVNGNLEFKSTNDKYLTIASTLSTLNVGGNLLVDVNAGFVRTTSANVVYNLNLSGDFNLVSGTFTRLAGTAANNFNFVNASSTQTVSQSAGVISGIFNWNVGNGTSTNTVQLLTDFDLGGALSPFLVNENAKLDCGTKILSGSTSTFTLSNTSPGGTLITANTDGIELTGANGSIQITGARNYNANANYVYNGTSNQNTGAGLTVANELTISNAAHVNLTVAAIVSGNLNFTAGRLILGSSDLTLSNTAAAPVTGVSASSYVQTNSTGQLLRSVATAGLPINYLFPVGDGNYSPVSLNFTANNTARNIGTIVTAGVVPYSAPSADYINRNWAFTNSAAGTYTYTPTFTYAAGDVVGTATNMKISRYAGPLWTEYTTTVTPPDMVTTGSLTETTGPLSSYWTGRVYAAPANYVWNGSTSNSWNTATNWTPNGIPGIIDNVTINTAAINPCVANGVFFGANNFTLNGTGNFTLAANAELTINGALTYVNTASATFTCSSTLNISSTVAQTIPALNYGSLNLTGGNRTLVNGGTIGICGSYTTGAGVITITNNTINYNATGAQTIAAATYNNLIISNNRGGGLITLEPGTITVNGVFTPSLTNYTSFVDGNTFHFNGGNAQVIPAFNYFNITSANFTRTWANSGIIDVKGTFTPAATVVNTITGSTVRFSSELPGINLSTYTTNVTSRNFNNVIFDGVGGSWNAGAANLRPSGTLTVNNGTVNVATAVASILAVGSTTTVNGGTLNLTSGTATGTGTFSGAVTVNGGQLNLANGTATGAATVTAAAINVLGGLFVVSNSASPGTLTQSGTLTINGGSFRMSNAAGTSTVTLSNNTALVHTSGSMVRSGTGASNIVFNGGFAGTKRWSQGPTATVSGLILFRVSGTFPTLLLLSDIDLGGRADLTIASGQFINVQGNVISGGDTSIFRVYNGGRFTTSHPDGLMLYPTASGCVQTKTRYLGGSVIWTFNGTVPQRTGDGFPGSVDAITISNSTGFTLDVPMRIQNSISISGNVYLGDNNLTLQAGVTIGGGSNSASKMIVTDGLGMLVKMYTSATNYTYPIGDNTGTPEYSPVRLAFTSLSGTPDSIGFRVTNAQHPNDFSTSNYITRYWTCNQKANANYTYTAQFTYVTADVVGVESALQVDRWSNPLSTWTQDAGSSVNTVSNVLSTSSLNQTTGTLLDNDFTGRSDAPFYYQSANSGPWSTIGTWEISTDPSFLLPTGVPAAMVPDATNSSGIFIRNSHNVTLTADVDADQMVIDAGGTLTINSGKTFTLANGLGTDLSVNGTINNAGTLVTTGTLEFNNGAIYDHQQNGGTIPTAAWNNGSTCQVTGITNTAPSGLNQTFYNFGWNCAGQLTDIQLTGALTTINNNFTLVSTGGSAKDLRIFDNGTTGTLNIGSDLNITGGRLAIINSGTSGAGAATVNVAGNLSVATGAIDMTGTSAFTAGGSNLNIQGDVTIIGLGQIIRTQNVPSVITFNKTTGTQLFSVAANSINSYNITWRIGDGVSTNNVDFNSNISIHTAATMRVMSNATLNCGAYVLVGGDFENQIASTLGIGSTDGIANAPAAAGNIQTTDRAYLGSANYTYNAIASQVTGNGLPFSHTGILDIANTGAPGDNIVTLTSTGSTGSTLVLTSGLFAIGTGQQYNISNAGTVSASAGDFASGITGGTLNFNGAGTFSGNSNPYNVFIAGAVNFGTGTVTIQNGGTLRINTGGSVASNAAFYGTNSSLQYYVNGTFNRALEWSAAAGKGFPYHVQLSNNTVLNAAGAAAVNAALVLNTAGNVTVDAGSTLSMNFGGNNMTVPLNVAGDITFEGSILGSGAAGGTIALAGNWINNGANLVNFTPNSRLVTFNGSTLQTIGGSNNTINPFSNVTLNNAAGATLGSIDAQIVETLTLSNGKFDLNSHTLTIGTNGSNGAIVGGDGSAYLISGNAAAQLIRYTTTNATTYAFPVGDASVYTPMTVQFFTSPMAANTQLSVNVIPTAQPNLGTSTNYLKRYWQVEPINLPNAVTNYGVSYTYDGADVVGLEANIKPYKHNALGWIAAQGSGASFEMGTGTVTPATHTITWTGLNNFSDFTGNGNGSPLPISLLNFDAQVVLNEVALTWTTATEINNDFFSIERSKDGVQFNSIGTQKGAGNSNEILNYTFMDENPFTGISYYRLKQTDFDGKYSYSDVKAVSFNATSSNTVSVYPNPATTNTVTIQLNQAAESDVHITVTDIRGKQIMSKQLNRVQANEVITLPIDGLDAGVYFIEVGNADWLQQIKLSVVR